MDRRDFLRLAAAAPLRPGSAVTMAAGTAKVDVTPDRPRVCATGRTPAPGKVYHPIQARCLSLFDGRRRLVIVTYDFNCLDVATPILRERVERELGIDPAYLVLLATHNHQAPIQIVRDNFDYGRWLAEKIFGLIQEAIKKEDGPVKLEFGFGHAYFVRVGGNAPADHEVQVLKVTRRDRPVALLFNHAAHPLMGPQEAYGASHPGYAMDEVEARFPGALALYADACGGNQYCLAPDGVSDVLEACRRRGRDLAEVVIRVATGPLEEVTGQLESQWKVLDLPLGEPLPYTEALKLARANNVPLDIGFVPFSDRRRPMNWLRALLRHYQEGIPFPTKSSDHACTDDGFLVPRLEDSRKYPCRYEEVLAARIGRLTFFALQGEPCAPIGARIKDVLRQQGPVMVCGYFAEHNLYIPTRELVRLEAYQSQVIRIQYASPVGWSPAVEDEMVRGALAMLGAQPWPDPRAAQRQRL